MYLLVTAHPGSPGKRAVKQLCVCFMPNSTKNLVILDAFFPVNGPSIKKYLLVPVDSFDNKNIFAKFPLMQLIDAVTCNIIHAFILKYLTILTTIRLLTRQS